MSSKEIVFNMPKEIQQEYLASDCGYMATAFNKEFNLPLYGLFFEDPEYNIPAHYLVKCGNRYMDITGVWNKETIIQRWSKHPDNESGQVFIKKVPDDLANSDYYDEMVCDISGMRRARKIAKCINFLWKNACS